MVKGAVDLAKAVSDDVCTYHSHHCAQRQDYICATEVIGFIVILHRRCTLHSTFRQLGDLINVTYEGLPDCALGIVIELICVRPPVAFTADDGVIVGIPMSLFIPVDTIITVINIKVKFRLCVNQIPLEGSAVVLWYLVTGVSNHPK